MISYDDFKKVEIRAGKILSAEKIPDTDKLLRLSVDFAETISTLAPIDPTVPVASDAPVPAPIITKLPPRQIVSGISMYFPDPAVLVGKTCMFVTNLEPRKIKGYESNGMLFAVSTPTGGFSLLEPNDTIPPGTCAA
ncbi:MAG: hypothetical protein PHG25_02645 [Candidatus Pacebacteria bacterium]|nr:hypothetical protein [Candidatus Paceibacterota bacterium]